MDRAWLRGPAADGAEAGGGNMGVWEADANMRSAVVSGREEEWYICSREFATAVLPY